LGSTVEDKQPATVVSGLDARVYQSAENRSRQQVTLHHRRMWPEFIRLPRFGTWGKRRFGPQAGMRLKDIRAAHHHPGGSVVTGI
jgi:hypothetical protein